MIHLVLMETVDGPSAVFASRDEAAREEALAMLRATSPYPWRYHADAIPLEDAELLRVALEEAEA